MNAHSLLACTLLVGCGYPEFEFTQGADTESESAVVDTEIADTTVLEEVLLDTSVDAPDTAVADTMTIADACASCATEERCVSGACHPPISCAALHAAHPTLPSAVYKLDPDGPGPIPPFSAFCEMVEDGGGWTLALKADGTKTTFAYESALWTNSDALNASSAAFDNTEAKLASFWTMPFTTIRLGMSQGGTRRYVRLPLMGTSLRALFAGPVIGTSLGRAEWLKLVADPKLQTYCGAEGINRDFRTTGSLWSARARIGIFGNNETDCGSPDSYVAFGAGFVTPHDCVGPDPGIVVGNYNPSSCGNVLADERRNAAFGYVFIQ